MAVPAIKCTVVEWPKTSSVIKVVTAKPSLHAAESKSTGVDLLIRCFSFALGAPIIQREDNCPPSPCPEKAP